MIASPFCRPATGRRVPAQGRDGRELGRRIGPRGCARLAFGGGSARLDVSRPGFAPPMRPRVDGCRAPQQVPLGERNAERAKRRQLELGLDALGDRPAGRGGREVQKPDHQGLPGQVRVDPAHEPDVELHERRAKLNDMPEIGDAGPGVVDRNAHLGTEKVDRGAERFVVGDDHVLGHLQHERSVGRLQESGEASFPGHQGGRDVEAEPCAGRQPGGRLDRGGQSGHLQLALEAHRTGVREDEVGADPA